MKTLIQDLSPSDGAYPTPKGRSIKMAIQGPVDFVDFFSGCGGMSSGFHKVGLETGYFRWMGAFDIDEHANKTYEKNFGHKPVALDLSRDPIRQVKSILLKNGHRRTTPLIVIGCAPCQGFSSHKKKDKRIDARNSLVSKFAEIATSLKPHFIIMENVPDLLARKHFHHFARFHEVLKKAGYRISADIINMAEFGVPQERHRAVIIASRIYDPLLPLPLVSRPNFKTVRQAIVHLPILSPQGGADAIDLMHRTSNHKPQTIEIIKRVPQNGGSRPKGVGPSCLDKVDGFYDVYGRLSWDKPAITITARCRTPSCGRFAHPEQNRGLSIREAALLQGFPVEFYFEGPFDDCYKQIGNAVPPLFSLALAKHLHAFMKGNNSSGRHGAINFTNSEFESYSISIAHKKRTPLKAGQSDEK